MNLSASVIPHPSSLIPRFGTKFAMNICGGSPMSAVTPEITAKNFNVTPDVRQLIENKLGRVEDRLFDDVISVRVVLEVEKYRNICEIFIVGKEHDVKT